MFPYFRTRARTEVLFPPLGPALLSAHLKRAGVEARVFDGTFSSFDGLLDELVAWRPAIVGISAMVSLTGTALRVAAAVRERLPDALLVAGGPLPTVFPDRFLPHVDVVVPRGGRPELPRVLPRLPGPGDDPGHARRPAARGVRRTGRRRRRRARGERAGAPLAGGDRRLSAARPQRLRPPRLPARVGAYGPPSDHAARDPGLSLRLRVLLQAGLRQRRPPPPAGGGHGRGRRHRPPGVRRPLDRRRHLHAPPRLPGGVLPAGGAARTDVELPVARQRDRPGDRRHDAGVGLPARLSRSGVRQPGDPGPHAEADDGRAEHPSRERVQPGGHRGRRLLHRRLPGRDRGRHRGDVRVRSRPAARRDLVQRADAAAGVAGSGSAWAAATRAATGRTRTRSPSSSAPTSTRRGCGGGSTRR